MGFIKGHYVPKTEEIIDIAFAYARKEADKVDAKDKDSMIRQKEKVRIKRASDKIINILSDIIRTFPSLNHIDSFYKLMFENAIDVLTLRKALSHLEKTKLLIKTLENKSILKLNKSPPRSVGNVRKEYFGRLISIVKKLKSSLKIIKEGFKIAAELPKLKDLPTIVLIGLPNVGKSTFLKNVTNANVEIKSYPFTTKKIQLSYLEHKYLNFQLVDSPGLLDRPEAKQNAIERKTVIALKELANSVIFILDPLQEIKSQMNLIKRYNKKIEHFYLITKIDGADEDIIKEIEDNIFRLDKGAKIIKLEQTLPLEKQEKDLEKVKDLIYQQNKSFYRK